MTGDDENSITCPATKTIHITAVHWTECLTEEEHSLREGVPRGEEGTNLC